MLLHELADLKPGTMIRGLTIKPSHLGRVAHFSVDGWENQSEAVDYIRAVHVAELRLSDDDKRYFVYTAAQLRKELFTTHPYDQELIKKHTFPESPAASTVARFDVGKNIGMYLGSYYLAYDPDYDSDWTIGVSLLLADGRVAYLRGTVDQGGKDDYSDDDGIINATSLKSFGNRQFLLL